MDYQMQLNLNFIIEMIKTAICFLLENIKLILLSIIIILVTKLCVRAYWIPVVLKKVLSDVGFDHIPKGRDRDRNISLVQASRRIGTHIPPPYPNGWFALAECKEFKIGDVLPIYALGENLCLYRGEDGVARCVNAYCPHLGAHLGVAGTVRGNCIQCPFHKWTYDERGVCVSIPGVGNPSKGVSIKTWRTVEVDGAIWIWYDAEGREPLWDIANAPSPETKRWGYRGRSEHYVNVHIQEIPENGADVSHLNSVHTSSVATNLGERYTFLHDVIGCHVWTAAWSRHKTDSHIANMTLTHDYRILKHHLGHVDVSVAQIGPGHVRLSLQTPVGPILMVQSVTPIAPLLQKVVHRVYSPAYNAPLAVLALKFEGDMFERDIRIWNNKMYLYKPAYVRSDQSIRAFRAWFAQFYSENSTDFSNANQNTSDW